MGTSRFSRSMPDSGMRAMKIVSCTCDTGQFRGAFTVCTAPLSFPWFMANFAQRLREPRTARSLTQTRLAELPAISPRVYSRWETGDVTLHFDTIVRLADSSRTRIGGRWRSCSAAW
jgi:DNA-binding XRE family transcriptional regulator